MQTTKRVLLPPLLEPHAGRRPPDLLRLGARFREAGAGHRLTAVDRLTKRERDVVRLLRAGKQYKTIASELVPRIQPSTARVLGSRALRKLGGRRLRLPEV